MVELTCSATFEDVGQVVRLDPGIGMRLLRYIDPAAVSVRSNVTSLRQALVLVGANTVRRWLLLMLLGDLGASMTWANAQLAEFSGPASG